MNEKLIENIVRDAYEIPEVRSDYNAKLRSVLTDLGEAQANKKISWFRRPALTFAALAVAVLILVTAAVGPQKVFAAVSRLLGYIPGVGVVETGSPYRILAEPVTVERDGVTIRVNSAFLSADQTRIAYGILGIPDSAKTNDEGNPGCFELPSVLLPDGTSQPVNAPIPASVNEASLLIPCLPDTLPGKAPENWQIPLTFKPAPADMAALPIVEVAPTSEPADQTSPAPAADFDEVSAISVTSMVETKKGYILVISAPDIRQFQNSGPLQLIDARGKAVSYRYPLNLAPELKSDWAAEFNGAGVEFPLTIRLDGHELVHAKDAAPVQFSIDVGSNPQPGDVWHSDTALELGGYPLKLIDMTAGARTDYSLRFDGFGKIVDASVEIEEYLPVGGGGGYSPGAQFGRHFIFQTLPAGELTFTLSRPVILGDARSLETAWTPPSPRVFQSQVPEGVCFTAPQINELPPLPAEMALGKVLSQEKDAATGVWSLVLRDLAKPEAKLLIIDGVRGSISPDGKWAAYDASDNLLHLVDLETMEQITLSDVPGWNPVWSPDSRQVLYKSNYPATYGEYGLYTLENKSSVRLPLNDASVIGWSADRQSLLLAEWYQGSSAWQVSRYELASGAVTKLFVIEKGTMKYFNPKMIPGQDAFFYRGVDSSSVYTVNVDGSGEQLWLDAVNAVEYSWANPQWVAVSLRGPLSESTRNVLIDPSTCTGYSLPAVLNGTIFGITIP